MTLTRNWNSGYVPLPPLFWLPPRQHPLIFFPLLWLQKYRFTVSSCPGPLLCTLNLNGPVYSHGFSFASVCSVAQSCVTVTSWTVVLQAPLSVGLSQQEYWSGLPFPPPDHLLVSCSFCTGRWILYHCTSWEIHIYIQSVKNVTLYLISSRVNP